MVGSRHLVILGLVALGVTACGDTKPADPVSTEDIVLPNDLTGEGDVSFVGPDVTDPEPDVTDPEPDVAEPEPDVTDPEPDVTDPEPDVVEPDVTDPEPDVVEPDVVEPDVTEEDAGPPEPVACEPALELTADSLYELPYGLVPLQASGGTGAYLFTLVQNESGALVNELTGAYLSGGTVGGQDVIELTDTGCIGSTQLTIEVVAPMIVKPESAEVAPGTSYQITVLEGSGSFACVMSLAGSGGTVTAEGLYIAGDGEGTDVIACADEETGESQQVSYVVDGQSALVANPPNITVAMGSTYAPRLSGGSGHVSWVVEGESLAWEDGMLVGLDPGQGSASAVDDYTGQSTSITVTVVAPFEVETVRAGDATYQATVLTPGDINGDGWPDAILAIHEADILALDGGGIYVYAGKEGGMEPNQAPAQILAGPARRDRLGRHAAVGDVDQDGHLDLVVGANQYDGGATDNGGLLVYRGVADGFFEPEPHQVLVGLFGFDHLGFGVVTCDVNGDGWLDLVGAARLGENRDLEVQPKDQGALYVFLGSENGFPLKADQILYGKTPEDGAWVDAAGLKMGYRITSGDFDGDGSCDVAVSSYDYSSDTGRSNDGAVFLYQGQAKTELESGGLSAHPVRAWAGFEGNATSNLGRELGMGDLDGDGKDELLLCQYKEEAPGVSGSNHGALRVFKGGELTAAPAEFLAPSGAELTIFATQSGDAVGWATAVGDVNADGIGDLLVTSLADEVADGPTNTGTVAVHLGQEGALPSETADRVIGGKVNGDTFGLAAGVLGDLDGDGQAEIFAYAGRDNTLGIDVGLPYMVRSLPAAPPEGEGDGEGDGDGKEEGGEGDGEEIEESPAELVPLDMPASASGSQVARGVAVLQDLNGDGLQEVAVGSPNVDNVADNHLNRGQVTIYAGAVGGLSTEPLYVLDKHVGHSTSDFMGYGVADAGDFDGDGFPDVAVLSRGEDRPGNFNNAAYAPDIPCVGSNSNTGTVAIYRSDGATLMDDQPAFIWYGSQKGQNMERMAAGLDINGDGRDDFVAGGDDWDRPGQGGAGGFSVVFGLWHWNDPKVDVICEPEFTYVGLLGGDRLASDITGIGDVNGDGCDDFAVGANAEDIGGSNRGSVRVFFGWGGEGCPAEPSYVFLSPMLNNAQAGISVDGGLDMDGDQIPDLVVGGHNLTVNSNRVGAAWFISGAYIASLPAETVVDDAAPGEIYPFIPQEVTSGIWMLTGEVDDEEFGRAVAMVPDVFGSGSAGLAVGGPFGNQAGVLRSGGVGVYGLDADPQSDTYGLRSTPVAVFGGETVRASGRLGFRLDAGLMGDHPVVMVGGYEASGLGLDQGAAYVVKLPVVP